jgi:hypothetical protein
MDRRGGEAVERKIITKIFVAFAAEHNIMPKAD